MILCFISSCFYLGCVERKLTIVTEPAGALVSLNDEEIGVSPVTVGFEWYGDYNIRLAKEGYLTTSTHRNLQRPLRDKFPFDLLDDMFRTRVDEYTWNFKLEPYQQPDKEELIDQAVQLRKEALVEPNSIMPPPKAKKKK
ncbi:MAG: hypothetical protein A2Y10_11145 [Planctomycetes bacterium GWF2_41_51]|nr:MAG: hypothetical protein A2Y10_11145 [Planctomycetes bacterium GWF2_41_51]